MSTESKPRKKALFLLAAITAITCLLILSSGAALAKGSTTREYGPYHLTNDPDSGTCGNNWAVDAFDRSFYVNTKNPQVVIEKSRNGHFVTTAGVSPGACDTGPNNGNTVGAGVHGAFHGQYMFTVINGTYNPNAVCTPSTCATRAGFLMTVYGPGAYDGSPSSFQFHYSANDPENGDWTNASSGNVGDITGSPDDPGD